MMAVGTSIMTFHLIPLGNIIVAVMTFFIDIEPTQFHRQQRYQGSPSFTDNSRGV